MNIIHNINKKENAHFFVLIILGQIFSKKLTELFNHF